MKKKKVIIMFGAPGSGKGTQGEILEQNTKYKRYIMSDLIKLELKPESKLYDKIINKGHLMLDKDVCKIFERYFKLENKVILDGIPRKKEQGIWLYNYLIKNNYEIKLIFLDVDENKLLNRILIRAKKLNRVDDNPEIFKDRIKIFDKTKNEVLNIFKNKIIKINGDRDIKIIQKDILENLKIKK